jgi:hypothetical protein
MKLGSNLMVAALATTMALFGAACDDDVFTGGTTTTTTLAGGDPCAGVVCSASDQCHDVGTCDPGTGLCDDPTVADGTVCDDDVPATTNDQCTGGVCAGTGDLCAGVTCIASDQCHDVGTCDPGTGLCDDPAVTDGTGCEDGDAATCDDECTDGICVSGAPFCIGALTVTLDFTAGATISTCGASLANLLGPGALVETGVSGTIATIGAIDAQGIDASAGLEYVWCSATGASDAGDYALTITEANDPNFDDISGGNIAVVVSSTTGGCHPAADGDDVCLTVTTSP